MKTTVLVVAMAVLYMMCMYSVRPSTHVPGLDGPASQCKNPYHKHHK